MSVKVMAEVFAHSQATLGARLVLLAIADCVDDEQRTGWPSIPVVAKKAALSERAVQYAVRALHRAGELEIISRPGSSNLFRIPLGGEASFTPADFAPVKPASPGGEASFTPGVKPASPRTIREPSREPSVSLGFHTFWKPYPKKRHQPAAWKAWRQVAGDEHLDAIMAGVERWKGSDAWRRGFIEDPATFLRQRQWEDEPDTPSRQTLRPPGRVQPPDAAATRRMLKDKGL